MVENIIAQNDKEPNTETYVFIWQKIVMSSISIFIISATSQSVLTLAVKIEPSKKKSKDLSFMESIVAVIMQISHNVGLRKAFFFCTNTEYW